MNEYEIITCYKEMKSIKNICEEMDVNYSNVINGKASTDIEKKVIEKLKVECFKMFSIFKLLEEN